MSRQRPSAPPGQTAAGPGHLAAAAGLVLLGQGFWGLMPGASAAASGLFVLIVQASVLALGFVILAARWEQAVRGLGRDVLPLLVVIVCIASAMWSAAPLVTLQAGLLLLLVLGFGIALALRFAQAELARITAVAALTLVLAQVLGQLVDGAAVAGLTAGGGELALALAASVWAAATDARWRTGWSVAAVVCAVLALATSDLATLGAGIGLLAGWLAARLARTGLPGVMGLAWLLAAGTIAVTLFGLFLAPDLADSLRAAGAGQGLVWLSGTGFAAGGRDLVAAFWQGTGVWGTGLAVLALAGFVIRAAVHDARTGDAACLATCGLAGAVALAPAQVQVVSPILVVLCAAGFAVAAGPVTVRERTRRRPLVTGPRGRPTVQPGTRAQRAPAQGAKAPRYRL